MIAQYPHFLCVTQITYEGRKKLLDLSLCQVISRSTKQNHYSLCVLLPPSSLDLRLMQPLGIMSLSRDAFFCFCDVAAVWTDIYKTLFSLTTANGRYVFPAKVHFSICKLTFFFLCFSHEHSCFRALRGLVLRARARDRGRALLRQVPGLQHRAEGLGGGGHGGRHQDHHRYGEKKEERLTERTKKVGGPLLTVWATMDGHVKVNNA